MSSEIPEICFEKYMIMFIRSITCHMYKYHTRLFVENCYMTNALSTRMTDLLLSIRIIYNSKWFILIHYIRIILSGDYLT